MILSIPDCKQNLATHRRNKMNQVECFEIPNTFTRDFSLDKQIALGICDWQAQIGEKVAFGHTKEEALKNLNS